MDDGALPDDHCDSCLLLATCRGCQTAALAFPGVEILFVLLFIAMTTLVASKQCQRNAERRATQQRQCFEFVYCHRLFIFVRTI